jgi:hypothetical protein
MSAAEVMVEGFPHGTPEGYQRGCRGLLCEHRGSAELMTCEQAKVRLNGDWAYAQAVKAGTATALKEQFAPEPRRGARSRNGETVWAAPEPVKGTPVEKPVRKARERKPRLVAPKIVKPKRPPLVHGTARMYAKGCRLKDGCPSKVAGGLSCTEAESKRQREYWAARRARERVSS